MLDLTCGLGVDSWALSKVAERVVSYERDAVLCEAARRNFARLGADNIEVRCETVTPETDLPEADLIFADPARRDAAGRKVFLLEDCTPDILTLLPMLQKKAPAVLLKLSPMADLTMLAQRLGSALREIHVVESDGEVKELLCLLLRDNTPAEPEITVVTLASHNGRLHFRMAEEREAEAVFAAGVQPGGVLLEPCPALLKAGAFNLPCARWGLQKLAAFTHLYTGTLSEEAAPWFKARKIREVLPFGSASFKQIKHRYPRAELTARNLPLGSAELQKKMGLSPGGDAHIFACRLADGSAVLIVCGD
ncbi:MAG: SAM-dependent methyltransferase [Bacteroidales bacterium]|nr:SAM-dependent methyltransferase [Bacteroidales bacterium]